MTVAGELDPTGRNDGGAFVTELKSLDGDQVRKRLSIYSPLDALMIDTIGSLSADRGVAKFVAAGNVVRPILEGSIEIDLRGKRKYIVTNSDVQGHFDPKSATEKSPAPPSLLPGVKIIAVSRTITDEQVRREKSRASLSRIYGVDFINPVGAGAELSAGFFRKDFLKDGTRRYAAYVNSGGQEIAKLGLDYDSDAPYHNPNHNVALEYPAEMAAQAVLLAFQEREKLDNMDGILPVYKGIEEISILRQIDIGEEVAIEVFSLDPKPDLVTGIKPTFEANAIVYKANGSIAQVIRGMTGFVGSRRAMNRNIKDRMKKNLMAA